MNAIIVDIVGFALRAGLKTVGVVLGAIIGIAYYVYFEGGPTGATFGKRAVGIRVVDFDTGTPIGYGRAGVRYIGRFVSAIVILLGYFWMLWDKEKQCWHDKFASDVVVPTSMYPVPTG